MRVKRSRDVVPHQDILSLISYYSTAWKTGQWPAITKYQIWLMTRPHAKDGEIGGLGAPEGRDFVSDFGSGDSRIRQ